MYAKLFHGADRSTEQGTIFSEIPVEEVESRPAAQVGEVAVGDLALGKLKQPAEEEAEEASEEMEPEEETEEEIPWDPPADDDFHRYLTTSEEDAITFAFAGDILFDPGYAIMTHIRQNGGTMSGVMGGGLLEELRSADVAVINNEFSYSDRGAPREGKTFTFRAAPESAALLNEMGIDLATFANNHSYDYGPEALLDSLAAVRAQGIATAGAGADIGEASSPVIYENAGGVKVAVFAATQIERLNNPDTRGATEDSPGVFRCLDDSRLLARIREAREEGYIVIVCIHWGTENEEPIDWWQQKQAPEIAAAGTHLIIGAHPHILQGIGYCGDTPVVYSIGNFLFNSRSLDSCIIRARITTEGVSELTFIPALQSGCEVREATGAEVERILAHIRSLSPGVTIGNDGMISH
ncbi:MAG: CapA family protein [Butyrivibrio sp.]|nr:CapA family protein [Butyrivibrio sp.]